MKKLATAGLKIDSWRWSRDESGEATPGQLGVLRAEQPLQAQEGVTAFCGCAE